MINFKIKKPVLLGALSFVACSYAQNANERTNSAIPQSFVSDESLLAPSDGTLHIGVDGSVRVLSGGTLTTKGEITNLATVDSFIVQNDAGLIQKDNLSNTGAMTVQRLIDVGTARTQYNYIGSPVTFLPGQTLKTIYSGIDEAMYYNETNNRFYSSTGANIQGRGLAVKEPNSSVGGGGRAIAMKITARFLGVAQNGDININIANSAPSGTALGFNLLANPYPSKIDLIALYNLNGGNTQVVPKVVSPNISSTFYFWDNSVNNGIAETQQGSGYSGKAYAVFNALTGNNGTGTAAAGYLLEGQPQLGSKKPTRVVNVGQGFMVRSKVASYNFKFNNTIRTADIAGPAFLRGQAEEDDRYWLQLFSPLNVVTTLAIVHFAGGNNAAGPEDSETRGGSDDFYSFTDGLKVAINGRSLFLEDDVIALGSKHFTTGNYRIAIDRKEGRFANGQNIYLKDKLTGAITNLSESAYSFAAEAGESTGRFEIVYKPGGTLATDAGVKESVVVYRDKNDFHIRSDKRNITGLQLFDSSGRLVYSAKPNAAETLIDANPLPNGVYFLRIERGFDVVSKKIIR